MKTAQDLGICCVQKLPMRHCFLSTCKKRINHVVTNYRDRCWDCMVYNLGNCCTIDENGNEIDLPIPDANLYKVPEFCNNHFKIQRRCRIFTTDFYNSFKINDLKSMLELTKEMYMYFDRKTVNEYVNRQIKKMLHDTKPDNVSQKKRLVLDYVAMLI